MLHRANHLFRPGEEFDVRDRPGDAGELERALRQQASGAFAVFLQELVSHIEKEEDTDKSRTLCYQITLVGHSMGAIIINEVLRLFPWLPVARIVYMSPACSIEDAELSVVPFLRTHKTTKFHILTLHPQAEVDEINAWDMVPRGSLLEWIDNFYTRPQHHVQRRLGKWINLMQALHIFREVSDQLRVKAFGVDGWSLPQKHGQFNLCPFWKRDFWDPDGPMYYYEQEDGPPRPRQS